MAVLAIVLLNVTIAEPAGGANNAMGPRTIVAGLGLALLVGGGGWFAFGLFKMLGGRRERS